MKLLLKDLELIGTGSQRKCYAFPGDASRCVKVVYNSSRGGAREIARETEYFRHLQKRLRDWRCIPRFYGTVETDAGTGYVFERVSDFDGRTSATLEEFIRDRRGEKDLAVFSKILDDLRAYLFENEILVRNLRPYNILCRRVGETETVPVVCDNLGAKFAPFYMISSALRRRRLRRKWEDFMNFPSVADCLREFSR